MNHNAPCYSNVFYFSWVNEYKQNSVQIGLHILAAII